MNLQTLNQLLNNNQLTAEQFISQGNLLPLYKNNQDFIDVIQYVLIQEFLERYPYEQSNFKVFSTRFFGIINKFSINIMNYVINTHARHSFSPEYQDPSPETHI